MTPRQAQAARRVRDAVALNMKVRLLADTRADLAALRHAIFLSRAPNRVTAELASTAQVIEREIHDASEDDVERALRDLMLR